MVVDLEMIPLGRAWCALTIEFETSCLAMPSLPDGNGPKDSGSERVTFTLRPAGAILAQAVLRGHIGTKVRGRGGAAM